jgi:palmitoyl-protein thioesterase
MRDAPWYAEDWFGLRRLDEAGRVVWEATQGDHLQFSQEELLGLVRRYLADGGKGKGQDGGAVAQE